MVPGRRLYIGEALRSSPLDQNPQTASLGGRAQKGWGKEMTGKHEVESSEGSRRQLQGLPVIRRNVAGIDLGSERHWVCAPTVDGSGREITSYGATTPELIGLAEWLKERQVESVAMESTGVYWIAPHEVLEGQGLQVLLVDTRQLARVPGRDKKTDPTDCEWIQRLHSCGLLRGSFRPKEAVCMLRTLVRDKANLVAESGDWLRRMQKSLDQMNVRVHRAVSDIDGVTGMAILRAIVGGEGDPAETRGHGTGRAAGTNGAASTECQQDKGDQKTWAGTEAAGVIPNERRRYHTHRCYRSGNGRSGAQRIRPRSEPLFHGEAVCLPRNLGAACAHQRGQAAAEKKAKQREHPGRSCFAHGGAIPAPQPDRPGSVLSQDGPTAGRRHCGVRHRAEVGHSDLPAAAMGPAVCRRRGKGLRNPLSPTAHRTLGRHSQSTRLSAGSHA